jgi:hypothetical protein
MNERIRELLKQSCGFEYDEDGNELTPILVGKDLARFVELILLEVTDILMSYRGKVVFEDGAEYNYEHPIIAIKKHFGVEE